MVEEAGKEAAVDMARAPRRRRLWPWMLSGLVVAAGIGSYVWFVQGGAFGVGPLARAAAEAKTELFLELEPAFVVNFREEGALRYLQVGITVMAHDSAAIDTAKAADPVIRDAMVTLLSNQDYAVISSPAGRQKLQAQALAAVQKVVHARLGRKGIDALYFTSFVIQ